MKRVKTTVTYKVPDWQFCNCSAHGKDMCRFCVKHGKKHICVLYNMPLEVSEGILVKKDMLCIRTTAGFSSVVDEPVHVDPKELMKLTVQEYRKNYKSLIAQGIPDAMADKLAMQATIGGN